MKINHIIREKRKELSRLLLFSHSGQNAASELPESCVFATMKFFCGGRDIIFSPKEPIIFIKNGYDSYS